MIRVAILDDYQGAALRLAEWGSLLPAVDVETFREHIRDEDELARRLRPFQAVVLMRERTGFPRTLIDRLPDLRLIVTTGMRNSSLDIDAASACGIQVCGTETLAYPTVELAWALILALFRNIPHENAAIRQGHWQLPALGRGLQGKTLGIVGLGRLGGRMADLGKAFGMDVTAWSPNLTDERAAGHGARRVDKETLFSGSDVVTVHLQLSERTRGVIGRAELGRMKKTAYLVNTSRGPLVQESVLLDCLRARSIAGAALDVFDLEPLPQGSPFFALDNVVLTPHLGYSVEENYRTTYGQAVDAIRGFLDGTPIRPLNSAAALGTP